MVRKQPESLEKKKLKWSGDFRPKSTTKDIVDDIYSQPDPIGSSLKARKDKGQTVTTVLRDTYSHNGRFYFSFKLKAPLDKSQDDTASETLIGSN